MMRRHIVQRLAIAGVALAILGGLLALDLSNRGLVWQFFWSQTGEESPLGQVRGMVELAGNLIRPQPNPDPLTPVQHANVNPYGVNTFLQKEVDPNKVDEQLRMISAAGFRWIRQEFVWEDIEVDGRGQFTDSRNDINGDGQIDTIDSWAKYDRIVDFAEQYGIQIQARLSNPPHWSRAELDLFGFGPPDDVQDYVNFAVAVAERYQGRVTHFQIWNEPNIFPEWGTTPDGAPNPVNPERYTDMLCRTYDALKAVDPNIVVISAAMAPTASLSDRDLNDFVFWQRMYDAGAGACFDVFSMQGYGLNSGPTDRRMRQTTVNYARNLYIRDLMVVNGDEHKPIWISEAAWNYVPSADVAPDVQEPRTAYGQVTLDQAARYMPVAFQRAQQEWPWVGVVNYWFFVQEDDSRVNLPIYYFRMVEPDYSEDKPTYTPLPVYTSVRDYITTQTPTLYQGLHQAEGHWAIAFADSTTVDLPDAQFGQAAEARGLSFVADGTDVSMRWQGETMTVTVDGETQTINGVPGQWTRTTLHDSLTPQTVTVEISSTELIQVDTVTVMERSARKMYPLVVPIAAVIAILILSGVISVRSERR